MKGLASDETCPECGRYADPDELVLYGWGLGEHEKFFNSRTPYLHLMGWIAPLPALILILTFFDPGFRQWFWHSTLRLLTIAALGAWIVYVMTLRRTNNRYPGLVQIRLSSRGCVQFDHLAEPGAIHYLLRFHSWLLPIAFLALLLSVGGEEVLRAKTFWPLAIPLLWVAAALGFNSIRQARSAPQPRHGSIVDQIAAYTHPTPWTNVKDFSLNEINQEIQRLRIWTGGLMGKTYPVDAEIRCTPAQAQDLERLIDSYLTLTNPPAIKR